MNKKIYKAPMAKAHQLRTFDIIAQSITGFSLNEGDAGSYDEDRTEEMMNNSAVTKQTWGSQW